MPAGWPGHLCPNFSDWEVGDILLVHRDNTATGRAITAAQTASAKPLMIQGARCSHAAVYVGNGTVVDATFGNLVGERSVWGYCHQRSIQVRRISHPNITVAKRRAIGPGSRKFIGQPYSAWEAVVYKLVPNRVPKRRALYCSTLVAFAVADATNGLNLASRPAWRPLYPAVLASHRWMTDVMLEWRQL